ncbi:hypothetical protein KCP76_26050 (plasmid) [Salmonella enterica subsp. enterica serovar Weltevreden]|nr:hypothetical protein KCP76_26050 [Salmonella enterica subsp. enterica serovar Weltevreden]QUJ01275.1 hypothetical protein KCP73_26795 [Salmonella enterica subsp. enterica]
MTERREAQGKIFFSKAGTNPLPIAVSLVVITTSCSGWRYVIPIIKNNGSGKYQLKSIPAEN